MDKPSPIIEVQIDEDSAYPLGKENLMIVTIFCFAGNEQTKFMPARLMVGDKVSFSKGRVHRDEILEPDNFVVSEVRWEFANDSCQQRIFLKRDTSW